MVLANRYKKINTIQNPQERGKTFEKFLVEIFVADGILNHTLSYRPDGEEIDGAIYWQGRTYLIEAKWHKDPMPASSIYAFIGKVNGKLSGTMGLYISMSGYSPDCEQAVTLGKELNTILFDREDIEAISYGNVSFLKLLEEKLFAAGKTGNIYYSYSNLKKVEKATLAAKQRAITISSPEGIINFFDSVQKPIKLNQTLGDPIVILCEGESDKLVLESIGRYAVLKTNTAINLQIIVGGGKYRQKWTTLPSIASLIAMGGIGSGAMVILLDSDSRLEDEINKQKREMYQILRDEIPGDWSVYVATAIPDIEEWLQDELIDLPHVAAHKLKKIGSAVAKVDWDEKRKRNHEINGLIEFLCNFIEQNGFHR